MGHMTIDQARRRLMQATGAHVLPAPKDPEWFRKALTRNARQQADRIAADDHDLEMTRWRRDHAARLRRVNDPRFHAIAADADRHYRLPIDVCQRKVRRWRAEAPDALAGYYERRVRTIAHKHGIRVCWSPTVLGGTAWSHFGAGAVEVPRPLTEELYATGLHELGHVLTRGEKHRTISAPRDPSTDISPLGEVAAWRVAQRLAGSDWTLQMQAQLRWALGTYARYATPEEAREMRRLMEN
jgi:hypothetical protein